MISWWGAAAVVVAWVGCAVAALWHVLLSKKSPQARLLWLLTVAVLPVLGPIAYAAVGVDRLGRRATVKELRNRAIRSDIEALLSASRSEAAIPAENRVLPEYLWGFARLLANLSRYRALPGNSVDVLRSGDVFFGRLVAAIDSARSSVLVESYIFDCDVIGHRLLDALGRAAQRGVRCCLLYDAVGSLHMDLIAVARAERLGVRVSPFAARSWLRGRFQINLRNHRKIAVVDGLLGYTGGMNISARHASEADGMVEVIDYHFEVRGPVVHELTAAFSEDWFYATGEKLVDPLYYPEPELAGPVICRSLPSGPDGDAEVFHKTLVASIHSAREVVRIASPYFIPDKPVTTALTTAALRGVRVEVVVPRRTDHRYVDWAMKAHYGELLEAGVFIYRRPAPFVHAKLLVIDDVWACIGSANIDPRSFRLNYELNLGVSGGEAVAGVLSAFEHERDMSAPLMLAEFEKRSVLRKAWASFWDLWSPLL